MKRLAFALLLAFGVMGCTNPPAITPPPVALAPGYLNAADQQIGEALSGARAFYTHIQADIQKGTYTPTAAEKTALNNFATTLNTAQAAYIAYHANPNVVTEDAASNAVQAVQQQQTALQPSIPGVN